MSRIEVNVQTGEQIEVELSQEEVAAAQASALIAADRSAFSLARQHLLDTDYAFTVDKYAQLSDERKAELTASREAARQVIREYQAKYQPLT